MKFRSPKELGALVRSRRKELELTQQQLAEKTGVQRLWIIQFEAGKPTVELGLVLRTIKALNMQLSAINNEELNLPDVDLDNLIDGED